MKNIDIRLILERMKQIKGFRDDKELAEVINVNSSTVSKWRTRNSIPFEVIINFSIDHNLDLNWLVLGIGENKAEKLATDEQMILLAYRALSPEQRLKAIAQMSGLGGTHLTEETPKPTQNTNQQFNNNQINNLAGRDITIKK